MPITNMADSPLMLIQTSPFDFTLTGSRFFNTARVDSDWDFFVQEDKISREEKGVRGWLSDNGFFPVPTSRYMDILTIEVWRKEGCDVQIVKDANAKVKVQEVLKASHLSLSKGVSWTTAIWNIAFQSYFAAKGDQ